MEKTTGKNYIFMCPKYILLTIHLGPMLANFFLCHIYITTLKVGRMSVNLHAIAQNMFIYYENMYICIMKIHSELYQGPL